MKNKNLLYLFLIIILSCKDNIRDDLAGNATIIGQLRYQDLYNGNGETNLLANKKVFISYIDGDSVNYLYRSVTDANGNFTFNRLTDGRDYLVFYTDSINKVRFSVYQKATAGKDTLKLLAVNDTKNQSGRLFYVVDANAQPLKNVTVGLFNNYETFKADSTNTNSLHTEITDAYGRVIFYNYKAGTYYLRAISQSNYVDTTFKFEASGIQTDSIFFRSSTPIKNTLLLRTLDENGHLVPDIPGCLYNNPLLFNLDSCSPSKLRDVTTGKDGTLKINNLPATTYYVLASTSANGEAYKGKATFNLNENGQTSVDIILKKVLANALKVRTVDEFGNILPGISVCLQNNPLKFNIETCDPSFKSGTTGNDGTVKFNDLNMGNYYLFATYTSNNIEYRGKFVIAVNTGGITNVDLVMKKVTSERELEVTVLDIDQTPVNGADLYFFTSRVLFNADTTLGNVNQKQTGKNGKVTITDLDAGKYYIRARVMLGDQLKLKGADSVVIPASGKTSIPITVK